MNFSAYWDSFSDWVIHFGIPSVQLYHLLCGNVFLNVSAEDAEGFEKAGNILLAPAQYLLAGNRAVPYFDERNGKKLGYCIEQKFDYNDAHIWYKTAGAYVALPSSLVIGSMLKGISYLCPETLRRHRDIVSAQRSQEFRSNNEFYRSIGIDLVDFSKAEKIAPPEYDRRPEDKQIMQIEKKALQEIVSILHENQVIYWLDCGTCLGAYRYGGIIPWDWDVDIAILQPDFDNVRHLLNRLDPEKYAVQDWSSRDKPKTYLKVYVKETGALIDIYHFAIDPEKKAVHSILSNGDCVLLPDSWKIRERRYTIPTPFELIFPLKKANFDGVEVFVPNKTKEYLQQRYGENIGPVKILNAQTGKYEKDPSHPYWQNVYSR
jgi:hypothetical protein